jgi:hypothetical protein
VGERLYRRMRQAGRGLEKWERRWCWRRETCGAEGEVVQQQQAVLIIGASTGHGRYGAGWGVSTCSHKRIDGALGLQNEDWAIPPQQTGGGGTRAQLAAPGGSYRRRGACCRGQHQYQVAAGGVRHRPGPA